MIQRTVLALLAITAMLSLGCKNTSTGSPAECEAIVERCHPLDTGSGPIHDCHEFAETAGRTAAECTAMQPSCFATCVATDGGATTDSGAATDAGVHEHDAG